MAERWLQGSRFSIAWSWPSRFGGRDRAQQAGLALRPGPRRAFEKHGIEPLVTISHYETPLHLAFAPYDG